MAGVSHGMKYSTLVRTTSNPSEVLPTDIVRVCEGSSTTLNWNYSLPLGLGVGVIKFNSDGQH